MKNFFDRNITFRERFDLKPNNATSNISEDLNGAGEQSFFTKYKTLIILITIGVLAAAGIYFYKKR
jgi:hypothetical protein